MKKILYILLIGLIPLFSQADLLDRIQLEDTIRNRLEDVLKLYDEKAKVLIRFDYKSYQGVLPGTSIDATGSFGPTKVESADVSKVIVEIYTELEEVPAEAKDVVFKMIPIEKSKVSVEYKKLKIQFPKDLPKLLDVQSLTKIAQDSINSFSTIFSGVFAAALFIMMGFMFYQNSMRLKEFKNQVTALTAALGEQKQQSMPVMPQVQNQQSSNQGAPTGSPGFIEENPLKKLSPLAIKELFSDCYWSKEDAYASWLWKNIDNDQKKTLLESTSFMKEYSMYFVDIKASEKNYHEHPYYLEPLASCDISNADFCSEIKKNYAYWHFVSPIRQQHMPFSLQERLKAVQSKPTPTKPATTAWKKSSPRPLELRVSWGDVSVADEQSLFSQPNMVPAALKEHIRSLVWLAQKDDAAIQRVLSKFDARSLALAWVGPEEVLKKLEAAMPEKKLRMLLTYKEKVQPSRQSMIYQSLVEEGLKNEAA